MNTTLIYKVFTQDQWEDAINSKQFHGAPIDLADGFIHFSSAEQVEETVAKHFRSQKNLTLASFKASDLGDELRWEVSRGGDLFPHLYGALDMNLLQTAWVLEDMSDGHHRFPEVF